MRKKNAVVLYIELEERYDKCKIIRVATTVWSDGFYSYLLELLPGCKLEQRKLLELVAMGILMDNRLIYPELTDFELDMQVQAIRDMLHKAAREKNLTHRVVITQTEAEDEDPKERFIVSMQPIRV